MASLSWPWEPLEPWEGEPPQDRLYIASPIDDPDLQPWERDWLERYAYDPERDL